MLLVVNAVLYLSAFALAVAIIGPMPAGASRRDRATRLGVACGGGLAIAAAIALGFVGLWLQSAAAGTVAIVVVGTCLWIGVPRARPQTEDEEDEDDDGGSFHRPVSPEPTKPEGGPSDDFWAEFDAARAGWAREREPTSV